VILVIDNYDSFTFNLVQAIGAGGEDLVVRRNDQLTVDDVTAMKPDAIVLSPGPGRPADAGCCVDVVRQHGHRVPILGVCLGHQAIAAAFGAAVVPAGEVVHGKTAEVAHDGSGVFEDLANPMVAARYHSLTVDEATLPDEIRVTARASNVVMAIQHRDWPLHGVQFHPESIATPAGPALLANFVARARQISGRGR
jgi:anthranilate synthase/aminodeoxychorismate synthase-like glutamine amidotransferase